MKKIFLSFLLLGLLTTGCSKDKGPDDGSGENPQGIILPRKEMRAVWIASLSRIDWPKSYNAEAQKKQYTDYLDLFVKYNVNAVVMQIRPCADAFYKSDLEPWSQYITGTQGADPGYDVLQFMIEEAHKRGLEFHAWLNPYRITNNMKTFNPAPSHIYNSHPEWTTTYSNLLLFRPALPEVRDFNVKVVDDLITKYDVDGIHFDDYFYPYPAEGEELDDAADYAKYGKGFDKIEDFRRDNVNRFIEAIHKLIVAKRPDVLFSVSPYGVWRNNTDDPNGSQTTGITNYDDLYADIRLWCEKGWIDFVVPQLYASTENAARSFTKLVSWWPKNSFNTPVIPGHGLFKFGDSEGGNIYMSSMELEMQFFYARRIKSIAGSFMYNASAFTANRINIMETVGKLYAERSLIPTMGRSTLPVPSAPAGLSLTGGNLSWNAQGEGIRAVVYSIDENNQAQIVTVTTENSVPAEPGTKYAVSLLNKDNAEGPLSLAQ